MQNESSHREKSPWRINTVGEQGYEPTFRTWIRLRLISVIGTSPDVGSLRFSDPRFRSPDVCYWGKLRHDLWAACTFGRSRSGAGRVREMSTFWHDLIGRAPTGQAPGFPEAAAFGTRPNNCACSTRAASTMRLVASSITSRARARNWSRDSPGGSRSRNSTTSVPG
jgi:hypothetical protein